MDPLATLKQSILTMPRDEGILLVRSLRQERLKYPDGKRKKLAEKKKAQPKKTTKSKAKPQTKAQKLERLKALMRGMTTEQRMEFLASMK